MKNSDKTLALKPYLDQIKKYCQKQSKEELIDLLCQLAQDIAPVDRAYFVKKICIKSDQVEEIITDSDDKVTDRIDYLKEDIVHRQESIEDGTYYDEYDACDGYGYDECPDPLSDEQKEDLEKLFEEGDQYFLRNNFDFADKIYQPLLKLFNSNSEDYVFDLSDFYLQIDWRETRARHCRSVYEITAPAERVTKMIEALKIDKTMFEYRFEPLKENHPSLQDIFDASPKEPPDWHGFIKELIQYLDSETSNRALILRLESIYLLEGIEAVTAEVRKKPTAISYLFWIDILMTSGAWSEIAHVAHEALNEIPKGSLREQAAAILHLAGKKLNDYDLILAGKREQFYSAPSDATLALLLNEAGEQNKREWGLQKAWEYLQSNAEEDKTSLKVKISLMSGQLEESFKMVTNDKTLGWSFDNGGIAVFVAALMTALTKAANNATLVQSLLNRYCANSWGNDYYTMTDVEINKAEVIFQEIQQGMKDVFIKNGTKQKWFAYLEKIIDSRLDSIVSNKRRKSYNRAAEALGALMECFVFNDNKTQAYNLLEKYRNQKYGRYPAFRREVDLAIKSSALLNNS